MLALSSLWFLILEVMRREGKRSRAESREVHLDGMWLPLASLSLGVQPLGIVGILWYNFLGA